MREISKLAGLPTSMPEASALIAKAQEAKEPKAREPIELAEVESIPKIPKGYADALEPTQERAKAKSAPSEVEKKLDSSPKAQATFTPIDDSSSIKEIQSELKKLNDKVKLIQNTLWDEKSPKNMSVAIPKEFAEIYRIAKNSGMNKAHLERLCG